MNQIRMIRRARRWAATLSVVPFLALAGCGDDPVGPGDGVRYLDEVFDVATETDLQYGLAMDENGDEEVLLLDLYQPEDDTLDRRPAVLWMHGGSFQFGHKGEMTEFARSFARRGMVSVSLNYRLRENQTFDYTDPDDAVGEQAKRDAQHDIQAAVRWLRANADDLGVDPDLIYLAGYSAGGTAALRVAASPDDPGSSGNPGPSSSVAGVAGISVSIEEGVLEAATGRTLLIHGTDDTKVPFAQVEAACDAAARCEIVAIDGGVHNMINSASAQIISETARFLHGEVAP